MNHHFLVKITNKVALYTVVALIGWVLVFLVVTVFDLKIFRQRMTELFFLSLLGLFAVLGGAIVLNVMSNLSRISEAVSPAVTVDAKAPGLKPTFLLVPLSLVLLVTSLFVGDHLSSQRRKDVLVSSAERLISENRKAFAVLLDYTFSPEYVKSAGRTLNILTRIDRNFPEMMVIFPDEVDGKRCYLGFSGRMFSNDDNKIEKPAFIYPTTPAERDYLHRVFSGKERSYRFHAGERGNYQLYFPLTMNGKTAVLYFSDFQQYGKLGS